MRRISSWGRLIREPHHTIALTDRTQVPSLLHGSQPGLAHGMGASYGDVCLNPGGVLWTTTTLDHFIAFDETTGILACEPGVLLRDIQRLAIPRGWILPVTPGTQLVTVGGAIGNDVHGKNHHARGTFGAHVRRLKLVRTDGEQIECGPDRNPGWFAATVGGLGLTGVVVEVELQLARARSPWIDVETIPYTSLADFFRLSEVSDQAWEHTVAWVDCASGRGAPGLFMRGNPAASGPSVEPQPGRRPGLPFSLPVSLVNRSSLRPLNFAYYHLKKLRAGLAVAHYEKFLYPLDNVREWNRVYGPKGFFQYQCVVPRAAGQDAVQAMFKEVARSGEGCLLGVLKTFGDRASPGMLSFPQPGVTFALDFPNKGSRTQKLFERLDAIVAQAGGRMYPAKDARMPRELFERGYPRLDEFSKYRDPGISSGLSRRLMGS